jgi:hypothetical protein
MNNEPIDEDEMPAEIDFSKGVRGLHHIRPGTIVYIPKEVIDEDDVKVLRKRGGPNGIRTRV